MTYPDATAVVGKVDNELRRLKEVEQRIQTLHRFRSIEDPHCVEDDELWPCRTEQARRGELR